MFNSKLLVCILTAIVVLFAIPGCEEPEPEEAVLSINLTSSSDATLGELVGSWESINAGNPMRYIINADSTYSFWLMQREKWIKQYDGNMWIEYHPSQGLYRTELHMSIPDLDDYGVRFHIVDDIIYFEEPTDGEKSLNFKRISDES